MTAKRKKGFGSLPTILKVLFVLGLISVLSGVIGLVSGSSGTTAFLGMIITGCGAEIYVGITLLVSALILYGWWERERWSWILALAWFVYSALNQVLALGVLRQMVSASVPAEAVEMAVQVSQITSWASVIVMLLLAWLVWRQKEFFYGKK